MKKFLIILFSFLQLPSVFAQKSNENLMSLSECIDFALKNNLNIKVSELTADNNKIVYDQSKYLKYPNLNGQYNANANAGRNIDPFSNSIVTQTIGTNNMNISTVVPIYDGFKNKNTVTRNALTTEASILDVQTQKNNVALQVASSYLNVLSTQELIDVAQKQLEVTLIQLERTKKLVNGGAASETSLYDLESQMANDELNLVNSKNNFETAMLSLKQNMNAPFEMLFSIQKTFILDPETSIYPQNSHEVYQSAIGFLPEVKAGDIRYKATQNSIAIARSVGLPTVSLISGWGTAYSTIAKTLTGTSTTTSAIPVTAEYQGQTVPLTINFPQASYSYSQIPFLRQISNNQNFNLGFQARIPIFNAYNQKYQTAAAKIQQLQQDVQNKSTKLQIKQSIDQAYITMLNAQKRYSATLVQTQALEKSFKATEIKYNAGAGNFVDYNVSKSNLDRAKSNLIVAKYDYIFRIKVLDFYQNKPLEL